MGVEIETISPGDGGSYSHCLTARCPAVWLIIIRAVSVFTSFFRTDISEEGAARRGALCR